MSIARRLAASTLALTANAVLAACGPPSTGTIGVGVDAAGRPFGFLKVCKGEHMDGARLDVEPSGDAAPAVALWEARAAATGSTSWPFENPQGDWVTARPAAALRPGVVYRLSAGADDGSGSGGYVLFRVEDLKTMKPGQVRVYDYARFEHEAPAGEPTGSLLQQARDENREFMRVITQHDFERTSCLQ